MRWRSTILHGLAALVVLVAAAMAGGWPLS